MIIFHWAWLVLFPRMIIFHWAWLILFPIMIIFHWAWLVLFPIMIIFHWVWLVLFPIMIIFHWARLVLFPVTLVLLQCDSDAGKIQVNVSVLGAVKLQWCVLWLLDARTGWCLQSCHKLSTGRHSKVFLRMTKPFAMAASWKLFQTMVFQIIQTFIAKWVTTLGPALRFEDQSSIWKMNLEVVWLLDVTIMYI